MSENALKMLVETYGYDGNQSGIIISKIESGEKKQRCTELMLATYFFGKNGSETQNVNSVTYKQQRIGKRLRKENSKDKNRTP